MSSNLIEALNLPIRFSMRCNPVTVSPSEPVSTLMFRMVANDIGAVIVIDEGKPVGMITERDLLERVITNNKNVYETKAKDVMSKPLVSIETDRPIKEALELMRKHKIRRLAVTENKALIGLVTERRLLSGFLSQVY